MTFDPVPLRNALDDAVRDAVHGKEVAVAFSGGLDSGIISAIAKGYAKETILYTVGSDDSHDVVEAKASVIDLGLRWVHIPMGEEDVLGGLRDMIRITGTRDPVVLSFELPLFFVCRNCRESEIMSGQGADEMFLGYSKYVGLAGSDLKATVTADIKKLKEVTLIHEGKVSEHFGKTIHYPFLDDRVIKEADSIGMDMKIPTDDPASRKRVLRDVAELMGYHGISAKEKKAAQYGSGAMPIIKRICKSRNMTYAELIGAIAEEVL